MLKAPIPLEHQEQAEVVRRLRAVKIGGKKLLFCAVPNGVKTSARQAAKLKREGLECGVPDLLIFTKSPVNGRPTAVEMKRSKGGVTSDDQEAYLAELKALDWNVAVCEGASRARYFLAGLGYLT